MSNVQLSDPRSRRRWPVIVSVLVLLPLFIALFGWWQLKQSGITIKSLFPLESLSKKGGSVA